MSDHGEPAGAAAEAIQAAELSLARQKSAAAQVDLQVVTAVLNAHTARADGAQDLARLQSEVESAVAVRTDLDTPAGARAFQRYLLSRLLDIRAVIETAELDATSKATLSAALAALYANQTPDEAPRASLDPRGEQNTTTPLSVESPADLGFDNPPVPDSTAPAAQPAASTAGVPAAPGPPWTGMSAGGSALPALESPGSLGGLGGFGLSPDLLGQRDRFRDKQDRPRGSGPGDADPAPHDHAGAIAPAEGDAGTDADPVLGSPEMAAVITAAVAGTPIPEAFAQQGITIPPAGSPVVAPIDPARVIAGDVGVLADRHALALGNGKALLDDAIQPLSAIGTRGLLGWLRPVKAESSVPVPPPIPLPVVPTA